MRRAPFYWWMLPALLLACWLGARGLNARPIWVDEIKTMQMMIAPDGHMRPPAEIWAVVGANNPWQAPGYFIVLSGWGALVGWQPAILRALSLFFGLLAIAMTYRLGADWLSKRVGLFAALVLIASAFYAHYLVEMRVYTLTAFVAVAGVWAYLQALTVKQPRRWTWPALFLAVAATFYSHYLAAVPLVAVGVYHLLLAPRNRRWWQIAGVVALAGVAYLPWAPSLLVGLDKASDSDGLHETALSTAGAIKGFLTMFGNGSIVLFVVAGALAGLVLLDRRWRRRALVLCFLAAAALIVILGVNHVLRIMQGGRLRYLMPLWPLFALVVALGIVQLRRWPALMAAALALWVGFGLWTTLFAHLTVNLDGGNIDFPIQRVAALLDGQTQPGDLIVNALSDDESWTSFYFKTEQFYFTRFQADYTMAYLSDSRLQDENGLIETVGARERVWVAYRRDAPPRLLDGLQADLDQKAFHRCGDLSERVVTAELYVAKGVDCPMPSPPSPLPQGEG